MTNSNYRATTYLAIPYQNDISLELVNSPGDVYRILGTVQEFCNYDNSKCLFKNGDAMSLKPTTIHQNFLSLKPALELQQKFEIDVHKEQVSCAS